MAKLSPGLSCQQVGTEPKPWQRPPRMDKQGRPVEQLDATMYNLYGNTDPAYKGTSDPARRSELEADLLEAGLRRPARQ